MLTRHRKGVAVLVSFLWFGAAATGWTDTFHVSTGGADVQERDGRTADTAWKSLGYACERMEAGVHTIRIGPGTFTAARTARCGSTTI